MTAPRCASSRAGAAAASALLALLRPDQAGSRLRHLRAGLRHHGVLVLGRDAGRLHRSDPRPAAAGFLSRLSGARGRQRAARHGAAERQYRLRGRRRHLDRQSRGRAALRQRPRSDAQSRHSRSQSFRNLARWKILETPPRLETVHRIIGFQRRLVESGAFTNPRSHIYYLPELYSRLFRPLLCRVHGVAGGGAAGDRSRRHVRVHPRHACWPMSRAS